MNEHISEARIHKFIGKIVADTVPAEVDTYQLTAANIIRDVLNGKDPRKGKGHAFSNQFGGEVGEWAPYIQIIIGTVQLIIQCAQARRARPNDGDIIERWKTELKDTGLQDDVAESIPRKFGQELVVTIRIASGDGSDE